jgi:hypothetical protein
MFRATLKVFTSIVLIFLLFRSENVHAMSLPPTFTVDLSLPPSQRWVGALRSATNGRAWENSWGPIFTAHNESLFNRFDEAAWLSLEVALSKHYPTQAQEILTIASEFEVVFPGHYVSFSYLAGWVYYHSLAHSDLASGNTTFWRECTGILATDGTTVRHVANMDQSPTAVRNVTLSVNFVNGSSTVLFYGVDWCKFFDDFDDEHPVLTSSWVCFFVTLLFIYIYISYSLQYFFFLLCLFFLRVSLCRLVHNGSFQNGASPGRQCPRELENFINST